MTKLKQLVQWLLSPFAKLGKSLASGAPSLGNGSLAGLGLTPTETQPQDGIDEALARELDRVITEAYLYGIAVNGDYYRYHAQEVGAALSLGYLTTRNCDGTGAFGRVYRPTYSGILWVQSGWR